MKIAVIPARGGSKRIPRKNIRNFCGKPIIAYTIEAAAASHCFDRIVVSTEDDEIAGIAVTYGAEVPFVRPAALANDFATTTAVMQHATAYFQETRTAPTELCCIYATAPFVQPSALQAAFLQMQQVQAKYCFGATQFAYPIQRAVRVDVNGRVAMFSPEYRDTRSQDLETAYHDAGQFYWGTANAWKEGKPLFSEHATPFILPGYLVQDIDSEEDWKRAELMYQVLKQQGFV